MGNTIYACTSQREAYTFQPVYIIKPLRRWAHFSYSSFLHFTITRDDTNRKKSLKSRFDIEEIKKLKNEMQHVKETKEKRFKNEEERCQRWFKTTEERGKERNKRREMKRKTKIETYHYNMETVDKHNDSTEQCDMLNKLDSQILQGDAQRKRLLLLNGMIRDDRDLKPSLKSSCYITLTCTEPEKKLDMLMLHHLLWSKDVCEKKQKEDLSKKLKKDNEMHCVKEEIRNRLRTEQEEKLQRSVNKMEEERDRERIKIMTAEEEKHQILKEKQRRDAEKAEQKKWIYSNQLLLVHVFFISLLISVCGAENIGESVTVKLATKPILFAHDVDLVCTIKTSDTLAHMAWIKIPNGETIAVNNETTNNSKYQIDMKYESSSMKYKLTIRKFAQSDVNALYRCDSGFLSQYENLQLNKEDYIAMPDKNKTEHKISIGDGYLRGTIEVNSVYPEVDNCSALFEGEDITHHLETANISTIIDSMFYNMVLEISYKTAKCKGMINVTCSVGIKRIQLMTEDIDECSNQMRDNGISGERLAMAIVFPIVGIVTLVVVCFVYFLWKRLSDFKLIQESNTNELLELPLQKPVSNKYKGFNVEEDGINLKPLVSKDVSDAGITVLVKDGTEELHYYISEDHNNSISTSAIFRL